MISTLEPVVSVALAAAVLDESLTLWALAGGSLVVASVVAIARTTRITPP
jgi:drug/metabolite transporter (DMT)-like permease